MSILDITLVATIGLCLYVLGSTLHASRLTNTRLKTISEGYGDKKPKADKVPKTTSDSFMQTVVERLKLMKSQHAKKITTKLSRAGWRSENAMIKYLFFKAVSPILVGGYGAFLIYSGTFVDKGPTINAMLAILCVMLGYYAPEIYIKNAGDKRIAKLKKSVADTLDLFVICAEAGLSPDATINRVSEEIKKTYPEMSEELTITSLELGFLPDRKVAFTNFRDRLGLKEINALVSTLMQTEKYGTPLAQSMRVLAGEFRHERMMKAEEKAARLPALLTVPMIVFILPPLFVVLIGPGILKTVDALSGF